MAAGKKYKLDRTMATRAHGTTVYRIRALRDFGDVELGTGVKKGDRGGYIQKHANLSHSGKAWIFDNAKVFGDAKVSGNAVVTGAAQVYGDARVLGKVLDNARVNGNASVFGTAWVSGTTKVTGRMMVK